MIIDKNGKIDGKISIIDVFAVLILLVAVFGIGLRFYSAPSKNARQRVKMSYVVQIEDVRKYTVDAISKKGVVVDSKQKTEIGEITDVEFDTYKKEEFDSDGNIVYAEVPNKYIIKITVLSEGKESENGYYVGNDTELAVGSTVSFATKYANSSGKVISIEKLQ